MQWISLVYLLFLSLIVPCIDFSWSCIGAERSGRAACWRRPGLVRNDAPATEVPTLLAQRFRPYTLREGDTLDTITSKRGFTTKEVMKLNHNLDPNALKEGMTIMLPMGKLSDRDRQILDGMKAGNYRTYPIRQGEKLDDVLSKRNITMEEFKALNPELNVKKVPANTVIKLPARKFTNREREMLFGAGAPNDFFYQGEGSWVAPAAGFGAVVAAVVYIGMLRARKQDEDYHKKVEDAVRRRSMDLDSDGPTDSASSGSGSKPGVGPSSA